jgi:hypothetical protein
MASRSRADGPVEGGARIPNFFRMSVAERIAALHQRGLLSDADVRALAAGEHTLRLPVADKMIENVVGVFGLPMGYALNFLIDGRESTPARWQAPVNASASPERAGQDARSAALSNSWYSSSSSIVIRFANTANAR